MPAPPPPPIPWRELAGLLTPGVAPAAPRWRQLRALLGGRSEALPTAATDWDAVAQAARHAEVAVLAAESHPELGRRLDVAVRRQVLVDMNLELALDRVVRALADAGVARVALFKGEATAHTLYARPSQRFRRDIDLLVARDELPLAVAALVTDGWRESAAGEGRSAATARAWPLELDLPLGAISCDVHQEVFEPGPFRVDAAAVIARALPGLAPLPVASLEDNLLITAGHLAKSAFQEPLKAWLDLARMVTQPGLDADAVATRARTWGLEAATWASLHVLDRWFGVTGPRELARRVRPPAPQRAALRWLLAGDGAFPLRRDLSRHAASAVVGPLTCDDPRALGAWAQERVARRLATRG